MNYDLKFLKNGVIVSVTTPPMSVTFHGEDNSLKKFKIKIDLLSSGDPTELDVDIKNIDLIAWLYTMLDNSWLIAPDAYEKLQHLEEYISLIPSEERSLQYLGTLLFKAIEQRVETYGMSVESVSFLSI